MWSRKKRKKEAAAAAAVAGGVVKEGAGSSNGSGPPPGKPMLSDLSRSRSQSGSPMKEPQQRGGSVGPRGVVGESSLSLANGSLPPAPKPQALPPPAPQASHPLNLLPDVAASANVLPQPTAQYPLIQTQPVLPPHPGGGTSLPPQLHPHAPVVNPQSLLVGETVVQGGEVSSSAVVAGDGGIQVKQALKTLANPNIKPSLTVPLPTVPLSASILDSLHENASGPAAAGSGSLADATGGGGGGGGGSNTTIAGAGDVVKDSSNSTGSSAGPDLREEKGGGGIVSSSSAATQQLQQVIDAQRTQIALLRQLVTDQTHQANPQQDPGVSSGGIHVSSVPPGLGGYPQRKSTSITLRTQTFDYGNKSNKVLENAAVQQLEREYYHGDPNSRRWS